MALVRRWPACSAYIVFTMSPSDAGRAGAYLLVEEVLDADQLVSGGDPRRSGAPSHSQRHNQVQGAVLGLPVLRRAAGVLRQQGADIAAEQAGHLRTSQHCGHSPWAQLLTCRSRAEGRCPSCCCFSSLQAGWDFELSNLLKWSAKYTDAELTLIQACEGSSLLWMALTAAAASLQWNSP